MSLLKIKKPSKLFVRKSKDFNEWQSKFPTPYSLRDLEEIDKKYEKMKILSELR